MGSATSESVNTSEVGVIIADTASIITMACLRYLRINSADRSPNLANIHESIGISKTTPMARHIITIVESRNREKLDNLYRHCLSNKYRETKHELEYRESN